MRLSITGTGLSVLLVSATSLAQPAPAPAPPPPVVAPVPPAPAPPPPPPVTDVLPPRPAPPPPPPVTDVLPPRPVAGPVAAPPPPATDAPPPPPAAPPEPPSILSQFNFAMHGFAGVSFYVQDSPDLVLNGQGPLLPLASPSGATTFGADIRQSRFSFAVTGPKVLGATPKALLEIDLFGLDSPGGYGEVSVYTRVRLAYAEMNWGNDVLRLGQDHELILAMIPDNMGHQAFLPTYFNGQLGWREPGAGYFHTFPLTNSKLELALQVNKSDWQNPADFGTATTQDLNVDYGQLSGLPAAEARIKFAHENVTAFVAGHYNRVAGSKAANLLVQPTPPAMNPTRDWDVIAGVAGVKVSGAGFSLAVSAYVGKNTGPLLGEMLQFFTVADVSEWGGWAQAMYKFNKHFDISALGGTAQPNQSDVVANGGGRLNSVLVGGMARFQHSGFSVGPEYYHMIDKDVSAKNVVAPTIFANQGMLTGLYSF